jgi:lysophospholipase L1-like esterase
MRSGPIAPRPAEGMVRILCVGDSITNGGTRVGQADTYPGLLERMLRERGHTVEVFNASAGGWALENEAGWVAQHGIFAAHVVMLQVATHDLFQRMAGSHLVDLNPSFSSAPPPLALLGVWRRVVMPRLGLAADTRDPGFETGVYSLDDVRRGLGAIERVRAAAASAGARLLLVHVEQPDGLEPQDKLTLAGKSMLREWAASTGTLLVPTAEAIRAAGGRDLFADAVHPDARGNAVIARVVADALVPVMAADVTARPK